MSLTRSTRVVTPFVLVLDVATALLAIYAIHWQAPRPDRRLAVMDFGPPPGAESDTPAGRSKDGHHGITPPTLERELKAAGFEIVSSTEIERRVFMVVARRPRIPEA